MTQDQNTTGTSRKINTINASPRRAIRYAGGVSLIAMTSMLGAVPARATPLYAQVNLNITPSSSSASGFVTSGSQQQITAAAIAAALDSATGSSTVTGNSAAPLPSTTSVTGNKLAAYATGNAQTNGVDLATIGSSGSANGIAVLAEQSNTYTNTGDDPVVTTPTTINSSITNSTLLNQYTNATSGDALASADNLIAGQATGNIAVSSVNGVVPVTYTDEAAPGVTTAIPESGAAQGNIVVGTSQANYGIQNGAGSYSTMAHNGIGLQINSSGLGDGQYLALATSQMGNVISSEFLGNSANNDIGVSLTSGATTGTPTLNGSLAVTNQQNNESGDIFGTSPGTGATNKYSGVYTSISQDGEDNAPITLQNGSTTQNNNIISSSAIGNSATGATAAAPGNEITLGINLAGVTTTQNNTSNGEDDIGLNTGADLALSNLQLQGGTGVFAGSINDYIGTYVQNAISSSIGVMGNAITSNAADNLASNAINTATGVGINLISGLTALNNVQSSFESSVGANTHFSSIQARAEGYNGEDTGGVTNSTETVSNDSLTATSNVNQATNSVALSASTINAGILGAASDPAGAFALSGEDSGVGAGVSLNNDQVAFSESGAVVGPSNISAYAGGAYVNNDSLNVTNPSFLASATTNNATNNITLAGSQAVSGAVGLQSTQIQFGFGTGAFGEDNVAQVSLQSGGEDNNITGSSGVLSGASMSAEATDNYVSNTLAVSGGQISNVTGGEDALSAQSGGGPLNSSQIIADLALNNVQNDLNLPSFAATGGASISVNANADGGDVTNSAFTVSGPATNAPTVQSLAIGNEALNTLSAIADTILSDTAGLVNAQENSTGAGAILTDTTVSANVNTNSNTDDVSGTSITVGSGAVGGSNGNIVRSLAYDNQASNTLTASAGTVDLVAAINGLQGSLIPLAAPSNTLGEDNTGVAAAYGLLNDQVAYGEDSAAISSTEIGAFIGNTTINSAVTDVTASTAGNALVSSVFANQADNSATLSVGNLSADTYYPAADVTNVQVSYSSPDATLDTTNSEAFTTQVLGDGDLTASTLGVTGNTALTQAEENQASNSLDTTGGNIVDTAPDPSLTGLTVDTGTADVANATLAFTVQNVQNSQSGVTAAQTNTNALLAVGGAVDISTLTAADNIFEATAYSNNATNSLAFGSLGSPVNSLDTSGGVQNVQTAAGAMTVTLGAPAVPGTPEIPGYDGGAFTVSSGSLSSGTWTGGGTGLTVATNGVTLTFASDADAAAFASNIASGTYTYTSGTNTISVPVGSLSFDNTIGSFQNWNYTLAGSNSTAQGVFSTASIPAVPGTPASPSVVISTPGAITGSTLAVTGNAFKATTIANAAVNTADIAATNLNGGAGIAAGTANANVNGTLTTALADYAVSNVQSVTQPITAQTNGEVAINPNGSGAITDSTLSVSGNTELAKAEGNIATNTLSLAATTADGEDASSPTAALVSNQSGTSDVSASSGSISESNTIGDTVTAPGAITGSTLTMDNNSSTVLAIVNNVTNVLSVSATILDSADPTVANASAAISASAPTSTADYALTNVQSATGGTVAATAVTQLINADSTATTTTGLVNSAVDISGNSTAADATASTASNTLDMSATDSTANGALTNSQTSSDTVTATGLAAAGFALNGGATVDDPAASGSTISVSGNSMNEQAIGNQASNALNATTGAAYGSQLGAFSEDDSATATYAVLNSQSNSGAVTATGSSGSQYAVALNSGGATTPVGATTISVTYNTMDAAAFGNSASNSMTVAALNSGNATAALQNQQTNTGAISSSITGATIGAMVGSPGISGATLAVGNNSIVSSAVGNTATNEIVH